MRHRYLFAIEDPFELEHNVARTVTHPGIVAIRDEFRRAWRILNAVGRCQAPEGELFAPVIEPVDTLDTTVVSTDQQKQSTQQPQGELPHPTQQLPEQYQQFAQHQVQQ